MEIGRTAASRWLSAALLCGAVCGCKPAQQPSDNLLVRFEDPAPRGRDTVAIVTPARERAKELWTPLVSELSAEFDLVTVAVDASTTPTELDAVLVRTRPVCIVVLDNRALSVYRRLQHQQAQRSFPPSVILMTSYLEEVIGSVRRATGIAYEIPLVSSFVALRDIAETPVRRVGIVYRKLFGSVVATQARLAAREKLTLVTKAVDDSPTRDELADALSVLIEDDHVDALWVLNDNSLLTRDMILEGWLPALEEKPLPVVVGVSALVRSDVRLGTLAVLPEHAALAVQAANMILDLKDSDWQLEESSVEKPLAVRTVVNLQQLREHFGLRPGASRKVDEIVE